jgi:hypothetical protein
MDEIAQVRCEVRVLIFCLILINLKSEGLHVKHAVQTQNFGTARHLIGIHVN